MRIHRQAYLLVPTVPLVLEIRDTPRLLGCDLDAVKLIVSAPLLVVVAIEEEPQHLIIIEKPRVFRIEGVISGNLLTHIQGQGFLLP